LQGAKNQTRLDSTKTITAIKGLVQKPHADGRFAITLTLAVGKARAANPARKLRCAQAQARGACLLVNGANVNICYHFAHGPLSCALALYAAFGCSDQDGRKGLKAV
jgi:hypothetical protein